MKIENSKLISFSLQKKRTSNCFQNSRFSVQRPPVYLKSFKPKLRSANISKISVSLNNYQKLKEILEWRKKTQFPIAKIKNWNQISKQSENGSKIEILIELQNSFKTMNQIKSVSLIQAIYILKESLIGFDRLCYRFEKVTPTSGMIFFDSNGYCKVWINQDLFQNFSQPSDLISQKEFIKILCSLIKQKTQKSKKCQIFFDEISACNCFIEAIETLRKFVKEKNMQIPCLLRPNIFYSQKSLNKRDFSQSISNYNPNSSVASFNKIPAFLKNSIKPKLKEKEENFFLKRNDQSMPQLRKFQFQNQKKSQNQSLKKRNPFFKSPSHKVIGFSRPIVQENQIRERISMRGTFKFNNTFKIEVQSIYCEKGKYQQSLNTTEASFSLKKRNPNLKKLFDMGRLIAESQQTNECQFELEYGQRMLKQEIIRNEFINLLS